MDNRFFPLLRPRFSLVKYYIIDRRENEKIWVFRHKYIPDLNAPVDYTVWWNWEFRGEEMHKAVVDIVRAVTEGYQVFSFLKRHVGRWKSRAERKCESVNGLADDLHTLLRVYQTEDCLLGEQHAVLYSHGHHRKLIDYLEQNCWRGKRRYNRYWGRNLRIDAYREVPQELSGEDLLQWSLRSEQTPDLQIRFYTSVLYLRLSHKDEREERYIQGVIAAACEKYGLDTEWEV